MRCINELSGRINEYLGWDKRRVSCFCKLLVALMVVQSVNMKRLACAISGKAKRDSSYRRLQRFFSEHRINFNHVAILIVKLFSLDSESRYLILDRTNWKWGKSNINILFLCIAYRGAAIPVFWLVLNKQGNSSTRERIALIKRFIRVFGDSWIRGVLGDREFIGKKWFSYLEKNKIPYYFRIKKDANTINRNGKSISVSWLFHNLKLNEQRVVPGKKPIYGHDVYLVGMPIEKDYLIIVTNKEPDHAINIYAERWQIETLFGCLKSKGFYFEDTRIINRDRIKKMIAVLAIAFCWAHLTGEWSNRYEKVIPRKKHGRLSKSYFRLGLDIIAELIFKGGQGMRKLTRIFRSIFPPEFKTPRVLANLCT